MNKHKPKGHSKDYYLLFDLPYPMERLDRGDKFKLNINPRDLGTIPCECTWTVIRRKRSSLDVRRTTTDPYCKRSFHSLATHDKKIRWVYGPESSVLLVSYRKKGKT